MADMQTPETPGGESASPALFPPEPKAPAEPAPGLLDILAGLFSAPGELFRRLNRTPVWGAVFAVILSVSLFSSLSWASKVDNYGLMQRQIEMMKRKGPVEPDKEAMMLDWAAKGQPYVMSTIKPLVMVPFFLLFAAGIYLALAKLGGKDDAVGFRHALGGAAVGAAAGMPLQLLGGVMCLLRDVGTAPDAICLSPTDPLFWFKPESPTARGLLSMAEPFSLFSLVVLYLMGRHMLKLKAWSLTVLMLLFGSLALYGRFVLGTF